MKYQIITLCVAFSLATFSVSHAQEVGTTMGSTSSKFYGIFRIEQGVGMRDIIGHEQVYDEKVPANNSVTAIRGTELPGLGLAIVPGYTFNDVVSAELGLNYVLGSEVTVSEKSETDVYGSELNEITTQANIFFVEPTLVFQLPLRTDKYAIRGKMGIVVPFGKSKDTERSTIYEVMGGITSATILSETQYALTVGFRASIGVEYRYSDKVSFVADLFYMGLKQRAKNKIFTSRIVNGQEMIHLASTAAREIHFVDELTNTSNNPNVNPFYDSNKPLDQVIAKKSNNSRLGLAIGLRYRF